MCGPVLTVSVRRETGAGFPLPRPARHRRRSEGSVRVHPGRGPVPVLGYSLPFGSFRQFQPVAGGPAGRAGGACCALRVPAGIPGVICGYPRRRFPGADGSSVAPTVPVPELYVTGERPGRGGRAPRIASGPGTLRTCWPPPGCVNLRLESWCWRELWSSAHHLRRCLRQPPVSTPARLRMNDLALDRFIFTVAIPLRSAGPACPLIYV